MARDLTLFIANRYDRLQNALSLCRVRAAQFPHVDTRTPLSARAEDYRPNILNSMRAVIAG